MTYDPAAIRPVVYIVDDQPDEILLIRTQCESIDLSVETFQSPQRLLKQVSIESEGCVVADLRMTPMTGLQLHNELRRKSISLPVIIVTGHADAVTCRAAFNDGVFDFVEKGFDPRELLDVIQAAIQKDAENSAERRLRNVFLSRLASLSPREKDVVYQLVNGKTLKEIAVDFGISVQTASKHRSSVFGKLQIANEVSLLKMMIAIDPNHGTCESFSAA